MFNRKKIETNWRFITALNDRIRDLEIKVKEQTKTVECKTCGCLIKKEDRFAVEMEQDSFNAEVSLDYIGYGNYNWTYEPETQKEYYCLIHKPPYDRVIGDKYYKDNVEVDNKGKVKK